MAQNPAVLSYSGRVPAQMQSEFGIVSVFLGVVALALTLLAFAVPMGDATMGCVVMGTLTTLGGMLTGLVGLIQKDRKRALSMIGVSLHGTLWIVSGLLIRHMIRM